MTLVYANKLHGDLKLFDVRTRLNVRNVIPAFHRLRVDPHSHFDENDAHEHRRYKGLCQLYGERGIARITKCTKDQLEPSLRAYEPFVTDDHNLERIIDTFLECLQSYAQQPPQSFTLLVEFQRDRVLDQTLRSHWSRMRLQPKHPPLPQTRKVVQEWMQAGTDHLGIICIARENVLGGVFQFSRVDDAAAADVSKAHPSVVRELPPGFMMVWKDAEAFHRTTQLEVHNSGEEENHEEGYVDSIWLKLSVHS